MSNKHKNFEQLLGENAEKIDEFSLKELIGLSSVLGVNLLGIDATDKQAVINRIKTVLEISVVDPQDSNNDDTNPTQNNTPTDGTDGRPVPKPRPSRPLAPKKPEHLTNRSTEVTPENDESNSTDTINKRKWFAKKSDPFAGVQPLPPMTGEKTKPSGLRTGNLELSKTKLESAMDEMLRDIDANKSGGGDASKFSRQASRQASLKPGKDKSLESTLAVIELREKLPSVVRRKHANAGLELDMSKRQTTIEHEYFASEEDILLSAVQEEEVIEFEQGAKKIAEISVGDCIPMIEPVMDLEYEMTDFIAGEDDDKMKLSMKCLDITWEVERSFSECLEMRDELAGNIEYADLADNFPDREVSAPAPAPRMSFKRRPGSLKRKPDAKESQDQEKEARKREIWLDNWMRALFEKMPITEFAKLEYLDDFFEVFWNFEEARKRVPPRVNYLAHLTHTRETAEALLKKKSPGTFLVRHKKLDGDLVVSCLHDDGSFWHGIVDIEKSLDKTGVLKEGKYQLRGTHIDHDNLDALVEYYLKEPYSKSHGKAWLLGNFCSMGQGTTHMAAPSI
eukprot:m.120540 g.120540  ORF g.120540 m.120540 type:complete len:565 (-) comp28809_c0_seq2:221-1915(-)